MAVFVPDGPWHGPFATFGRNKRPTSMITTGQKIAITPTGHSRLPETDLDHVVFGRVFSDHMFVMDYQDGQWQQPASCRSPNCR